MSKTVYFLIVNHYERLFNPEAAFNNNETVAPDSYKCVAASESEDIMVATFRKVCCHYMFDMDMISTNIYGANWLVEYFPAFDSTPVQVIITLEKAIINDNDEKDGFYELHIGYDTLGEAVVKNTHINPGPFDCEEDGFYTIEKFIKINSPDQIII